MEIPEQLIATRIRRLREGRRLTLEEVATAAGVSKSFLSKVERCNVSISIAALCRLASAFGVSIGDFFDGDQPESDIIYIPRGESRSISSPKTLSHNYEVLIPRRGMRIMQPAIVSVDGKKARFELRQHPGEQFVFMMDGEMTYVCGNQEFALHAEDCLYFNARLPHGPKLKRSQRARYLVVHTNTQNGARLKRSNRVLAAAD